MSNNSAATSTTSAGSPLPSFAGASPLSFTENTNPMANPEPMKEDNDSTPQQDTAPAAPAPVAMDSKVILKSANDNLVKLEETCDQAYAAYLSNQLLDEASPATKASYQDYLYVLNSYSDAKDALTAYQKI
ncbi:hypothetical protein INT47_009332 [Mucor saturninus]|uniref:Uncharacterized protein n=1 Tax=Mucor saturninus TaxID=64648 RepID=A0A8H7QPC5_9FUNG|nr:hypothetical protein INT47_009332 [Mucor saturninus]